MERRYAAGRDGAERSVNQPHDGVVDPIPEALHDELQSPSLFGRILLIAAFRNESADDNEGGRAGGFQTPEIQDALHRLHLEVFATWLTLSIERQRADISIYLNRSGAAADRTAKIKQLAIVGERAIPPGATLPERGLFLQDLRIVQVLLKYDQ
jgi:hypothetical protein